jgi:predicted nucleic acid-binding protein
MTLVVDASMAIAWLFEAGQSAATAKAFERVVAEGALVPSLWRLEIANALWSATRKGRCDRRYAAQSLERLARLNILTDAETEKHAWGRTRDLSTKHELSVYDATYLELAIRRRGTLATLDVALANAGRDIGIDVLSN